MKIARISLGAAFMMAVLVYIGLLLLATGMYVETAGHTIVVSAIGTGIVTALVLRRRSSTHQG